MPSWQEGRGPDNPQNRQSLLGCPGVFSPWQPQPRLSKPRGERPITKVLELLTRELTTPLALPRRPHVPPWVQGYVATENPNDLPSSLPPMLWVVGGPHKKVGSKAPCSLRSGTLYPPLQRLTFTPGTITDKRAYSDTPPNRRPVAPSWRLLALAVPSPGCCLSAAACPCRALVKVMEVPLGDGSQTREAPVQRHG